MWVERGLNIEGDERVDQVRASDLRPLEADRIREYRPEQINDDLFRNGPTVRPNLSCVVLQRVGVTLF